MTQTKFRQIEPDPVYKNTQVAKFINYIMQGGQKDTARSLVYEAFSIIENEMDQDPLPIFRKAISNTAPSLEVKSRRIGGATYQVPYTVKGDRRFTLASRWIIQAARSKSNSSLAYRLAKEMMDASQGEGSAVQRKVNTHRMAEANKAFAHFAF